jgi:hypothetical protein
VFGGVPVKGNVDVYKGSRLSQRTLETKFWSVVDLDGTFAAGNPAARSEVRSILEKMGAFIFCTARTPELVMSSRSYAMSQMVAGFERSKPLWLDSGGVHYDDPLKMLPANEQDPDAILAFGQGIYPAGAGCQLHRQAPYFVDQNFEDKHLEPRTSTGALVFGEPWDQLALKLLKELGLDRAITILKNVDQTKFRWQLDFTGPNAIEQKYKALALINAARKGPLAGRIEGVDESKPSDTPDETRATLYVMDPQGRKENMINYALSSTCRPLGLEVSQMSGLIIGDTLTDFYAACYAGWDANFTGIIVGGSRLSQCIEEKANFAGVDLRHMHSALIPTARKGFYHFINPLTRGGWMKKGPTRTVVIGDIAYEGTVGAETILAYLKEHQHERAGHV